MANSKKNNLNYGNDDVGTINSGCNEASVPYLFFKKKNKTKQKVSIFVEEFVLKKLIK